MELEKLVRRARRIVVACHRNADPDALASLYAMAELIEKLTRKPVLKFLPEGLNSVSKRILANLLGETLASNSLSELAPEDLLVVVDTASRSQLGALGDRLNNASLVVVDHHGSNELVEKAKLAIYDPGARSTSELVYLAAKTLRVELSKVSLTLLLAGIVYDTRHFLLSSPRTLRIAADIMDEGIELTKVLRLMQSEEMSPSEKIARLKAAMRMEAFRADNVIVVITKVSAFESSVAKALLDLGADIAIIVSEHKDETRIIARGRQAVLENLGIHLGRDLLERIAKEFGGGGGGHMLAAGASLRKPIDEVYLAILENISRLFRSRGLRLKRIA